MAEIISLGPSDTLGNSGVDGKVIIGNTPSSTQKLEVRGDIIADAGTHLTFYIGTGGADLGRYVHLINSPNWTVESGLKAGGVLVSDAYNYANPPKTDLIVKGKVGVGTPSPAEKLSVAGVIQSTTGGFKFPDGTTQTTAATGGSSQWVTAGSNIYYNNGNVGIRTSSPGFHSPGRGLVVSGVSSVGGGRGMIEIWASGANQKAILQQVANLTYMGNLGSATGQFVPGNDFVFVAGGGRECARLLGGNGNLGIGTTTPTEKLEVNGNVKCANMVVTSWTIQVPDYVFDRDYKMPSLEDVKEFVREHRRLPDIPSAEEMSKNGINLADLNLSLLRKVEELTLHLIDQNDRIKAMERHGFGSRIANFFGRIFGNQAKTAKALI